MEYKETGLLKVSTLSIFQENLQTKHAIYAQIYNQCINICTISVCDLNT